MVVSSSFRMTTRGCVFLRFWGGIFGVRRPDALLPSHHSSTPGLISGSYCYFQISFRYHQRSSNIKYVRYNQVSLYIYIAIYIQKIILKEKKSLNYKDETHQSPPTSMPSSLYSPSWQLEGQYLNLHEFQRRLGTTKTPQKWAPNPDSRPAICPCYPSIPSSLHSTNQKKIDADASNPKKTIKDTKTKQPLESSASKNGKFLRHCLSISL